MGHYWISRGGGTALAIAVTLAAPPLNAQSGSWALVNARIETVTRGAIDRGTVVIRDGLIEAVGASVNLPPDVRVVDYSGRTIYPGLIDLTSTIGLPASPAARPPANMEAAIFGASADTSIRNVGLEPGRTIANELRPAAADVRSARDVGIAVALVAPGRGLFRGLSALVPLRDDAATHWIVKSPVALHVGYQTVQGRYPGSLLGVIAYQRQSFFDAQRHATLLDQYRTNPRGMPRASYDADLDALVPVVRGQLPAFIAAGNENEIRRAAALAREFNLKATVVGAVEGFRAIDALKTMRIPVVTVDYPEPASVTGWAYRNAARHDLDDSTTRAAAVTKMLEGNAATLNSAGVKFALASGGVRPADFIANVRKAIAAGLPRQVALEALTIRAAEAAGVEQQLGSIEVGKIANLLVMDGEVLTDSARVSAVFVDGQRYDVIPAPATQQSPARGERRPGVEDKR
ncbi:MAG: Adenine deaminase [Gemmatimonadaceae bacterium]|nr:Adenine deaminase [Gemmatimonadaceae bacterium]